MCSHPHGGESTEGGWGGLRELGFENLQSVLWHNSIKLEEIKCGRGCLGQRISRQP